jgi:hypothetical protein
MEDESFTRKKRPLYMDDGNDVSCHHSLRSQQGGSDVTQQGVTDAGISSPLAKRALLMNDDDENDENNHVSQRNSGIPLQEASHHHHQLPNSSLSSTIATVTQPAQQQQQHSQQRLPHTYKVRSLTALYRDNRRTNDEIHSSIVLGPVLTCILDTPPMQRLRGLKQLGPAEYVYINVNHNRFEHSLGVAALAETLCRKIRVQQPSLQCTEKDVLCVQLAGTLRNFHANALPGPIFESFPLT